MPRRPGNLALARRIGARIRALRQRDRSDTTERTALPHFVGNGGACEPPHHQVRTSVRSGAKVHDVDDRWMAKLGQRLGLDARAIHEPRISHHLGVQQLDHESLPSSP
jgi:hypothetical protein